jgi:hypothetical protein
MAHAQLGRSVSQTVEGVNAKQQPTRAQKGTWSNGGRQGVPDLGSAYPAREGYNEAKWG